ncbi:S-adenosyl-L-methionine-dependent methyltransferase [Dichotomocladium elegans]|nr:S-adenosyl-L-methionine-dependent methyltransferase [Dichotomocladium elegans]
MAWSSDNYNIHAPYVPQLGNIILEMLEAQPKERILDFGCGDGYLTKELAKKCESVVGLDANEDMITKAKMVTKDAPNITYALLDGHDVAAWFDRTGQQPFDAVFSNATLHWLKKDPIKVIQGIHHVLKPNGRFVAEMGAFTNCGEIHTALITALNRRGYDGKALSPWYFPSVEVYASHLRKNGFTVETIESVPRPTELNTDIVGWLTTFGFNFLHALKSEEECQQVVSEIVEHLRPCYQREDGKWFVMYVRLRVVAYKKI